MNYILAFLLFFHMSTSAAQSLAIPINYSVHVVSKEADVDINTKKVAYVYGFINSMSSADFEMQMITTSEIPGDRIIRINSGGGEVQAGQRMIEMMEKEKSQGVHQICVVEGNAGSMAFNLLTHCDVRVATARSILMFHKIAYTYVDESSYGRLTPKKLKEIARQLELEDLIYKKANAAALHMSYKDYDMYADNDTIWRAISLIKIRYLQGIATVK